MKIIKVQYMVFSILLIATLSNICVKVYTWDWDTHKWLVDQALNHVPSDWKTLFINYKQEIIDGCTAPDRIFHDWENHVYHPNTGWGGAPATVAKWYSWFVGNLTNENYEEAFFAAGVLSHYVSDVCNPLHTDSSDEESTMHSDYEYDVGEHLFEISISVEKLDNVYSRNVSNYVKSLAVISNSYYDSLVSSYLEEGGWDSETVRNITEICLNLAVKAVASVWVGAIKEVETSIPEIHLHLYVLNPKNGSVVSGIFTLSIKVNDTSLETVKLTVKIDGNILKEYNETVVNVGIINITINSRDLTNGQHVITIIVEDDYGNSKTAQVTVYVRNEEPWLHKVLKEIDWKVAAPIIVLNVFLLLILLWVVRKRSL